ncbi:transcriptional regulator [Phaeodactylibacter sp.]|uniref:winged helix-turn-helix domain-containing protein n=1 Tax=Phaeodactylibacter sp. TaxID=1940289 RepID=UPI0025E89B15|nr:transcriptional regulator [Phaeodactylibacter sp.]MCI4648269.1 transcriptional regulator [Phaeodactylibacter sp.]MCI5091876.1 transcriptional regulator [Phaeodactylibacter sp.]
MKHIITKLNPAFDHRVRLGIMSVLMLEEWVDFSSLKETLNLTDGRLASHIKALEKETYLEVRKRFIARKPNTSYRATDEGRKAFQAHLDALEVLLRAGNSGPST